MQETSVVMDISKELNEEQCLAANHLEGPLLVLAGAGSGKTRCVTYRIINLLQNGISPRSILGLTFTNKAAKEMSERVQSLTNQFILISTFHSLGTRILRESIELLGYNRNFTIYDTDDSEKVIKECILQLNLKKEVDSKTLKNLISNAKNDSLFPEEVDTAFYETEAQRVFPQVYTLYQKKLKEYNAVDFDDLLFLTVALFKQFPECLERYQNQWHFLLIDEYQDTNNVQYELVKMLIEKTGNVFVVGDPDQSIYSWRGANIGNILNFEKDFAGGKVVYLEQNYRSTQTILEASNDLIQNNRRRYEKNLWSSLGKGELIKEFVGGDEHDEGRFVTEQIRYYHEKCNIPLSQMAIFYRTNFQSRVIEDHLLQRKIPYIIIGGISFYQRLEIKDVLSYIKMVISPYDYISFARSINLPKRGIGTATLDKIRLIASEKNMAILEFCKAFIDGKIEDVNLRLSKRQYEGLVEYLSIIQQLIDVKDSLPVSQMIEKAITLSGYINHLKNEPDSYSDRKANIDELIGKAKEWEEFVDEPTLENFLEEMSLKNNTEEYSEAEDRLNLMTLHNGKGLEFEVVFIIGVENELLPHANSRGDYEALEEERRLMYVGMTRAKKYLHFSHVHQRNLWGQYRSQAPSRFLKEISPEYIEKMAFALGRHKTMPSSRQMQKKSYKIEEEVSTSTFKNGDAVFHKDFGIGVVKKAYNASLGEMVDVLFSNDSTTKSLAVKYARLKKL